MPAALSRLQSSFDELTPQLRRAARWVADHPEDACFLSMREQARRAAVVPPTMTRLARAIGYPSYQALREDLHAGGPWRAADFTSRARRLQVTAKGAARPLAELERVQESDVASLARLNTPEHFAHIATRLLAATTTAFLGFRSCHSVALHAHYLYAMLTGRGTLLADGYGTLHETVASLPDGALVFAIGLAPYSRQTVDAVRRAAAADIEVVALTDSDLSPLARAASGRLLFEAASTSFFHSLVGAHALVERVMAEVAARGGRRVIRRLKQREEWLRDTGAYWDDRRERDGRKDAR
jgi:DNA-binding MurR/RpiR family transcriptional regulator